MSEKDIKKLKSEKEVKFREMLNKKDLTDFELDLLMNEQI